MRRRSPGLWPVASSRKEQARADCLDERNGMIHGQHPCPERLSCPSLENNRKEQFCLLKLHPSKNQHGTGEPLSARTVVALSACHLRLFPTLQSTSEPYPDTSSQLQLVVTPCWFCHLLTFPRNCVIYSGAASHCL